MELYTLKMLEKEFEIEGLKINDIILIKDKKIIKKGKIAELEDYIFYEYENEVKEYFSDCEGIYYIMEKYGYNIIKIVEEEIWIKTRKR